MMYKGDLINKISSKNTVASIDDLLDALRLALKSYNIE
jgi:hypothetical protein